MFNGNLSASDEICCPLPPDNIYVAYCVRVQHGSMDFFNVNDALGLERLQLHAINGPYVRFDRAPVVINLKNNLSEF